MKYKAYLVEEIDSSYSGSIKELEMPNIEPGNVIIKVHYSSLNYKDALAATGVKGVASSYPFVPGIDVAGEILQSSSQNFKIGDKVIATGYKLGMSVFGGFGELVQIPEQWVIPLPDNLSLLNSMSLGTAGLTAGACVKKILDAKPSSSMPILVSGATGGVGSVAVNLLSKLGFEVHAITGKPNEIKILNKMGASTIIDRHNFMAEPVKALDKANYSAGNVAGMKFTSSVFPFILRGISLIGIDSAESDINFKEQIWELFSKDWSLNLEEYSKVISLHDIGNEITAILNGAQIGRVVIKHGV